MVNVMFDLFQVCLECVEVCFKLVNSINQKLEWLVYVMLEICGMLLYVIICYYVEIYIYNVLMMDVGWIDVQVYVLLVYKQVIFNVMLLIIICLEWENVMQYMMVDGCCCVDLGKVEGDVVWFLDYGWLLNNDLLLVFKQMNVLLCDKFKDVGNIYLQKYMEKCVVLLKEFLCGYEVVYFNVIDDLVQLVVLDGMEFLIFVMMDLVDVWLNCDDIIMMV